MKFEIKGNEVSLKAENKLFTVKKLKKSLKSYEDYMDFFFLEHITGYTLYELAGD